MKDVVIKMGGKFDRILASEEFKEEYFVSEAQARLGLMLDEKGVTRAELARKLGVSRARVTQIFSDDASNLTLRLLARSYLALGEEPVVIPRSEYERMRRQLLDAAAASAPHQQNRRETQEVLTASLIAEALRDGSDFLVPDSDRQKRRSDSTKEWAESGTNVIPLRRAANG